MPLLSSQYTLSSHFGHLSLQYSSVHETRELWHPKKQNGTCGTGCLGSRADTLGVAEFDTVGKTFVANHDILVGTGYGSEPYASPDGKYILLMPHDGGKYVRVMRPGKIGVPSVSGQLVIPFLHKGIIPTCFSF